MKVLCGFLLEGFHLLVSRGDEYGAITPPLCRLVGSVDDFNRLSHRNILAYH